MLITLMDADCVSNVRSKQIAHSNLRKKVQESKQKIDLPSNSNNRLCMQDVAMLHGKIPREEKEEVMKLFLNPEYIND